MGQFNSPADLTATLRTWEERITKLERRTAGLATVGNGAPSAGLPDGALYGDKVGSFFYIVLGGVAKKVAVA